MPREAKPYLEHGWYNSRPTGRYTRLCPKEDGLTRARELLREELVRLDREKKQHGGKTLRNFTFAELFALVLDAVKVGCSAYTYTDYQRWLTEFARTDGRRKARDVSKGDVNALKRHIRTTTWKRPGQPHPANKRHTTAFTRFSRKGVEC